MAVRCLKKGAYDFVEKPFEDDVLLASVTRAVERTRLRREGEEMRGRLQAMPQEGDGRFGMIGRSRTMQDIYESIQVAAGTDAPVLICGETGTGKELVARAIHAESRRAEGPFVPVNAGALPEATLESELFGHARGAFTGAEADRNGKLVTASGGSLLLDEVESLSTKAQIQLLRVLEDGQVVPLGRDKPRSVDVRLLAATKVDLQDLVRTGRMREDFLHRIVVLKVNVPPVRDRREDIGLLVSHFLRQAAARSGMAPPNVPGPVLAELRAHSWPGNVRELRNVVERMVITARDGEVGPLRMEDVPGAERLLSLPTRGRLREELERTERAVIEAALHERGGEITATAAEIGISRRALYERMKKYDLQRQDFREHK